MEQLETTTASQNVMKESQKKSVVTLQGGYPLNMLRPQLKDRAKNEGNNIQKYETCDGDDGNNILVRSPTHQTLSSIQSYINSPYTSMD